MAHNPTNLRIAPYGCCHHLKMAAAALDGYHYGSRPLLKRCDCHGDRWQLNILVIKPITVSFSFFFFFTHNCSSSLVHSVWGELGGSVCVYVCICAWTNLMFAYATLKTVLECVWLKQNTHSLPWKQRKPVCENKNLECVNRCTSLLKKLYGCSTKGKLSIN